jgi:hypothetical protein
MRWKPFGRTWSHDALAVCAIAAVILVAERDTMLVECDQPENGGLE